MTSLIAGNSLTLFLGKLAEVIEKLELLEKEKCDPDSVNIQLV